MITRTLGARLLLITMAAMSLPTQAADMTLELSGIQAGKGNLIIALYNSADNFLRQPARSVVEPAKATTMQIKIGNLPAGEYAVSLYQDINTNNKLDRNFYGAPSEPYGFSNDAVANFGPATYKDARIVLPETGKTFNIKLHN